MSQKWYLSRNNEQYGPYSWNELVGMYKAGNISSDDLVWNEGWDSWIKVNQFPELNSSYASISQPIETYSDNFQQKKTMVIVSIITIAALILGTFVFVFYWQNQRSNYYVGAKKTRTARLPSVIEQYPLDGPVGSNVYLKFDASILEYEEDLKAFFNQDEILLEGVTDDVVKVTLPYEAKTGAITIKSDKASTNPLNFTVKDTSVTALMSQMIHPSQSVQTISYKDEVSISLPPNFIDQPRMLSISKVENAPANPLQPFGAAITYDISIDGMDQLPDYVKVKVKYNPDDIDPDHPVTDQLTAYRWDESYKQWETLPSRVIEAEQSFEFLTNHLSWLQGFFAWPTKIAVVKTVGATAAVIGTTIGAMWIAEKLCFSTYITPQGNFKLYYNKKVWDIHDQYNTWQKPDMAQGLQSYNSKYPNYIQDVGQVLEEAFSNYVHKKGFKNPVETPGRLWGVWRSPITVKISGVFSTASRLATGEDDPLYGKVFKALHFPAKMMMNLPSNNEKTYAAIGHELFHRIQAEYYGRRSYLSGSLGTGEYWWIEATAEYAGLMEAWGTKQMPQYIHADFKPNFFDFPMNSTGLVSSGWTRDYEYLNSAFIHFLVQQKGMSFKNIFEGVATGDPLKKLDEYIAKTHQGEKLGYYFREYARWAVFSDQSYLRGFQLANFRDTAPDRVHEIAEKKDMLVVLKDDSIIIKQESGRAWVDVVMLEEGKTEPVSTLYDESFMLINEETINSKKIKRGSILFILATNIRYGDDEAKISVKIDDPNADELTHTFVLAGNYCAKLWAIKIPEDPLLKITPDDVPDGKINEEYSFKLEAEKIPPGITEVDFEWDFGDGKPDSKGEQKGVSVTNGKAEHEISHIYKEGVQKAAITAKLIESKRVKEMANATAKISFDVKVIIQGGDVDFELPKGETEYDHTFEAVASPPGEYRYDWLVDGAQITSETKATGLNSSFKHKFKDGMYTVEVKLHDPKTGDFLDSHSVSVTVIQDLRKYGIEECEKWSAAQSGGYGTTVDVWDISKLPDGADFDIQFDAYSVPDRIVVQYNGTTVYDTGWRGSSSYASKTHLYPGGIAGPGPGSKEGIFKKAGVNSFRVIVYGPESGTQWNYKFRARCST